MVYRDHILQIASLTYSYLTHVDGRRWLRDVINNMVKKYCLNSFVLSWMFKHIENWNFEGSIL